MGYAYARNYRRYVNPTTTPRPARNPKLNEPGTDAQFGFIATLLGGRVVDPGIATGIQAILDAKGTDQHATKKQLSDVIGYLKGLPYRENPDAVSEPGYYEADGALFKVKRNRQATGLYAMRHTGSGWEYVPGGVHKLTKADAVTDEYAKALLG